MGEQLTREQNLKVMRWLWSQMHRGALKMPADRLTFEGDHDLTHLYNTGFVDTDRHTLQQWIEAFAGSRQPDGSYSLTLEQWLEKEPYRYCKKVAPPFDPLTIREGEWEVDDWKQLIREKFLPETVIPYEKFDRAIEEARKKGEFKDGKILMIPAKKQSLKNLLDRYPSPTRRRALATERVRQHEEFEAPATGNPSPPKVTVSTSTSRQQAKSKYKNAPDHQKQAAGKLTDLLGGSKK